VNYLDQTAQKIHFESTWKRLKGTSQWKVVETDLKEPKENSSCGKGCTDAEKLILTTISKSITKQTDRSSAPDSRLSAAISDLTKLNNSVNNFLKDDLKRYKSIQKNLLKESSYNQKNIEITKVRTINTHPIKESVWQSSKFQRTQIRCRLQTEGYNQLVGGGVLSI